jgi:uncharacterized protein YjbJ (UPF0337 family)
MMNWQQIEDQWGQLTTQASAKWLKLTDEDLAHIAGKQERLISKLQERYGVLKDDAEKQVHQWFTKLYLAQDKARSALARAMPVPTTKPTTTASPPTVEKAGT